MTEFYLKIRYGEAVQVGYVDMADPENQAEYRELVAVVEDRNLPYPLIAINGHLRAAGTAHYNHILPLVEKAFEEEPIESEA